MTLEEILSTSTMTIATSTPGGEPHGAPVYFVADDAFHLFFFSDPVSQHGQDLTRNPRAAVAIYPETQSWEDIRGLQLRGRAQILEPGPEWDAAWGLYQVKFPFVIDFKALLSQNKLYIFTTRWIRLVDNRQGFGFKREWTVP